MATSGLSFLTFNIGNPSEQRAQRQLAWLAGRPEHVLVLTETKASAGCRLIAEAFSAARWHVAYPVPGPGEYGVMIISRVQAQHGDFAAAVSYLPTRAASVTLPAPPGRSRSSALTHLPGTQGWKRPSASGNGSRPAASPSLPVILPSRLCSSET